MELTNNNLRVYAAHYYDNPSCLTEEEFDKDLALTSTILRALSKYSRGENVSIKVLINNMIMFYNVFDHKAASKILDLKCGEEIKDKCNSILYFLSFPLLSNQKYDVMFHRRIVREFTQ